LDQPVIIGVGGFTSNVGKTTLMCELLRAFPGWEAIKTTRGHYRSCGKDPHACCVSHLLSEEPLVRSGREATYDAGKDTARYWDAGASNVHWLIATDNQIEKGIKEALARVRSRGVFIEGNSFSQFVHTDQFVMVRSASDKIKSTAREALAKATSIYFADTTACSPSYDMPTFTPSNLPALIDHLRTSLECGDLSPLWSRSSVNDTKAALGAKFQESK
jgi:molybdopterin-guanine dinucleotide biosynthesis protein